MISGLAPTLLAATELLARTDFTGSCVFWVVLPVVQAIICWLLLDAFERIPERYRLQEPNMVWLLMVPLFNLYWNFKVYPALAESFQAYFYSHGVADVGDCGERYARWFCILAVTFFIPCFNLIAALVFLVLFLIEADKLKKRIQANA